MSVIDAVDGSHHRQRNVRFNPNSGPFSALAFTSAFDPKRILADVGEKRCSAPIFCARTGSRRRRGQRFVRRDSAGSARRRPSQVGAFLAGGWVHIVARTTIRGYGGRSFNACREMIKGIIKDKELLGTVGPIIVGAVFWYIAFSGIVGD
jgi:hypothetical protein